MLDLRGLDVREQCSDQTRYKFVLDVFGGIILLILSLPVALLVAFIVYLTDREPVLFVQRRIGENGKPFKIYKFRSFNPSGGSDKSRNDFENHNLTTIGPFIRRYRLDEIPQLLNIFTGDMSLVGPRPLVEKDLIHLDIKTHQRHESKPGITGLAQVCGNNALTLEERFQLDLIYVSKRSLYLDLKILALTLPAIAVGEELALRKYRSLNNKP